MTSGFDPCEWQMSSLEMRGLREEQGTRSWEAGISSSAWGKCEIFSQHPSQTLYNVYGVWEGNTDRDINVGMVSTWMVFHETGGDRQRRE